MLDKYLYMHVLPIVLFATHPSRFVFCVHSMDSTLCPINATGTVDKHSSSVCISKKTIWLCASFLLVFGNKTNSEYTRTTTTKSVELKTNRWARAVPKYVDLFPLCSSLILLGFATFFINETHNFVLARVNVVLPQYMRSPSPLALQ